MATHVQMALAIGYALGVGFAFGAPLKALVFQGTISTIVIVAIYMTTGLSCISYYLRERRNEFNVLLHGLIPLAVFVLFIPVLLAAFGVDFAGLGITPLARPANEAPYVIYGWMALGICVLIYFLATDRSRIARTGLVFEEPEIEPRRQRQLSRITLLAARASPVSGLPAQAAGTGELLPSPPAGDAAGKRPGLVRAAPPRHAGVLLAAPFLAQADATIANVTTPAIRGLGASGAAAELVICA